jgi:hypothetical protein
MDMDTITSTIDFHRKNPDMSLATKQDTHNWKGKAAFARAIFVVNCVGKLFFLVDG